MESGRVVRVPVEKDLKIGVTMVTGGGRELRVFDFWRPILMTLGHYRLSDVLLFSQT